MYDVTNDIFVSNKSYNVVQTRNTMVACFELNKLL